jgi:CRP-like cAMP-binding protein
MTTTVLGSTLRTAPGYRGFIGAKFLADLPSDSVDRLLYPAKEIAVPRGEIIFHRGEMPTGIQIIRSGHVTLCVDDPVGEEHVVEILNPGDSCGGAAIVKSEPHLLTARAIDDCRYLEIPRATVLDELSRSHAFALKLIASLSERLYRRTSDLENILLRTALGRVARFLIDELERTRSAPDAQPKVIHLEVGKGLIASKLNMTQEHFSRTLHALSVRGKIQVQGRTIAIVNEEGLRNIAA